jgi:hypothetical protein
MPQYGAAIQEHLAKLAGHCIIPIPKILLRILSISCLYCLYVYIAEVYICLCIFFIYVYILYYIICL